MEGLKELVGDSRQNNPGIVSLEGNGEVLVKLVQLRIEIEGVITLN